MILTKNEIIKEVCSGNIQISDFDKKFLGPASYDLSLGDEFRVFTKGKPVQVDEPADYRKISRKVKAKEGIIIAPGEFILGITNEKISLPSDIGGWLQGRSRFARLGLTIHITASFIQPGVKNRQVLEIYNAGSRALVLMPGTRICQLVFQRCEGRAKYGGRWKNQVL